MKPTLPNYKHSFEYNAKYAEDFLIVMQLYKIAKTSYSKTLPVLPQNDLRRNNMPKEILYKKYGGLKHIIATQLHLLTPLFRRTAA